MELKRNLTFVKQYIAKPRSVGAVWPSSKYLASKMIRNVNFDEARYIVEYGPGTGVFTDKMLKHRRADTVLLLLENNGKFYKQLKDKYRDVPNLFVFHDSAEQIGKYLSLHGVSEADYIISGLPFSSLPREISSNILAQTKKHLKPGGKFITFQYTLLRKAFIGHYFRDIHIKREMRNIPPAYVFCCASVGRCA